MNAPRSYLFVPGNRTERIPKALAARADAVIVDLEDAVPPAEKDAAREAQRLAPKEHAWAQQVVAADAAAGGRAAALDGQMVDRPVVERARAIPARAAALTAEENRRSS